MRHMKHWTVCILAMLALQSAAGQDLRDTLFADADKALADARAANADLLAPDTFEHAMDSYKDAEGDLQRGRNMDRIRNELGDATKGFQAAIEASQIASITLASVIKTRDDASNAHADTFASAQWNEAEESFNSAARHLESGDIRGARSRASDAETLYRDAELTAIKAQYLSQTRALLAQAEQAKVSRYAPKTLMRAHALLDQAEHELNENRYDTDLPRSLAQQANYEARHAIYLAQRITAMRDQDFTEEDIILSYEEPLERIAAAADKTAPLDKGVDPVVEDLVGYIEKLREESDQAKLDLEDSRMRIAELEDEIRDLDEQLGGVSQERVALVQRLEAEARIREQFDSIESLFSRDEARVSREGNNIVLRMVGLTFESGKAVVEPRYRSLLEKVSRAANVFPRSQIIIEGHTDSYGSDETNMSLSRQRAEAVSSYLTSEFGIPAFRMSAVGYGETRPIANNETPQGRARNRRIDIRIEPQIE
jgi:OOP family OmpA-OmpF porin